MEIWMKEKEAMSQLDQNQKIKIGELWATKTIQLYIKIKLNRLKYKIPIQQVKNILKRMFSWPARN